MTYYEADGETQAYGSPGLMDYFAKKLKVNLLEIYSEGLKDGKPDLPTLGTMAEDGSTIAKLDQFPKATEEATVSSDGFYYKRVLVRFWIEGWDPDSFDALFNSNVEVEFSFSVYPNNN